MGRQFRYYCLPEDLAEIQRSVFVPAQGELVIAETKNGMPYLDPVQDFALERDRMGKEKLHLLLLPPAELRSEVRNGAWLDRSKSHVVEVGRCFTDGTILRSARFWYETRYFRENQLHTKPRDFVTWAERIFRRTKVLLERHEIKYSGGTSIEWFGREAWAEVLRGAIWPVSN
jgi:hypothetical protein